MVDKMESLPTEILFHIASYLNYQDLDNWRKSSPFIQQHLNNVDKWNCVFRAKFGPSLVVDPVKIYVRYRHHQEQIRTLLLKLEEQRIRDRIYYTRPYLVVKLEYLDPDIICQIAEFLPCPKLLDLNLSKQKLLLDLSGDYTISHEDDHFGYHDIHGTTRLDRLLMILPLSQVSVSSHKPALEYIK